MRLIGLPYTLAPTAPYPVMLPCVPAARTESLQRFALLSSRNGVKVQQVTAALLLAYSTTRYCFSLSIATNQAHEPDCPLSPCCLEMRCVLCQVTVGTDFEIHWSVDTAAETISFEVIHPDICIYWWFGTRSLSFRRLMH